MAVLLSCASVTKAIGARVLFEDITLNINDGDRIGLIGPNGSGKTTLLEILSGREPATTGSRAIRKLARLAYVPQDSRFATGDTVGSVLNSAVRDLALTDQEKTTRVQIMIGRAGFTSAEMPAAALSGGWKKRLAIAAALIQEADVLLLDEPTNHLDLEGILWLERAIGSVNACLVVTHDRYFLENVATQVAELSRAYPQGYFQVNGNYSEFLERRQDFTDAQAKQQESLAVKVRREIEWLRRGPKARTGKSRARINSAERLIDQLASSQARSAVATTDIDFTASDRKTKRLIETHHLSVSRGGRLLFKDLSLTLAPGMRIGLVGANGSGKTTLLHLLAGTTAPDTGTVRRADNLRLVSFSQDRTALLDLELSLRRSLCPEGDSVMYRARPIHVAGWAKRFLFRDEQLDTPLSRLSGGERARVLIARLMLETADVLLLDEPTNDLDIPTLEVLEESLLDFPGAMVLVSHDRYLLDRVSTLVIGLDGQGGAGVFADYSQWEAARSAPAPAPRLLSRDRQGAVSESPRVKLSYLDQREWDSMEARILEAEEEVAQCEREVHDASSDGPRLLAAYPKLQAAQARVEELYARWAELESKIG